MPIIIPTSTTIFSVSTTNESYFFGIAETMITSGNAITWASGVSEVNLMVAGTIFAGSDGMKIGVLGVDDDKNDVIITSTGTIFGESDGIEIFSDSSGVKNYGLIVADGDAGIQIGTGSDNSYINNYGDVSAQLYAIFSQGLNASISNSGMLSGSHGVNIDGVNNTLVNTGTISANVPGGAITFTGLDDAVGVYIGQDDAQVSNFGTISGLDYSIEIEAGASGAVIFNAGALIGDVLFNSGAEILRNSGQIDGDITLGGGADVYRAFGDAVVTGTIDGGAGDDVIVGTNGDDEFYGGTNNDVLRGNAGEDVFYGGTGEDVLAGGVGDDVLYGGDDLDRLFGNDGEDILFGGAGDDIMRGDEGLDILYGGAGSDKLFGGAGADQFIYTELTESPDTNTGRDIIRDFEQGIDLIGISQLSNPAFSFIGSAGFSGTGPEVRAVATAAGDSNVYLDANGDGIADMRILVSDVSTLTADDFIL